MDSIDMGLVKRCKNNEDVALEILFKRFEKYIYTLCFHYTHSKEDALDLVQDVFIKIIKNIKHFDETRPLLPWIKKITVHACLNYIRDAKPCLSLDEVITDRGDLLKDSVSSQFNLEDYILFNDTSRIIRECIGQIDERYRMPVILKHLEQMTYEEIASTLDLPIGTVRVHLYRGRKQLKALLSKREIWG